MTLHIEPSLIALACAALADGPSELHGIAPTPALTAMTDALSELEVSVTTAGNCIRVGGTGGRVPASSARLNLVDQSAVLLTLVGVLANSLGQYTLDGPAELDVSPLTDPLRDLGAVIGFEGADGRPPVNLAGPYPLRGGSVRLGANGLAVLGPLLVALPLAVDDAFVTLPTDAATLVPPAAEALRIIAAFGVEVLIEGRRLIVPAPQRYLGRELAFV